MSKRKPTGSPRKNKGRWKDQRQAERRGMAERRNLAYSKLSIEDRIKKLDEGEYEAKKQRAKLLISLNKTKELG
jgi:hypothetical protein